MCLAQGHNTVMPVGLKPATPRSQVKYSTTELPLIRKREVKLLSLYSCCRVTVKCSASLPYGAVV